MKKLMRIALIGFIHTTVYLWLIPVVILPRFGSLGSKITIACVIIFSIVLLTMTFGGKRKKRTDTSRL